jgi:hypothetical protein
MCLATSAKACRAERAAIVFLSSLSGPTVPLRSALSSFAFSRRSYTYRYRHSRTRLPPPADARDCSNLSRVLPARCISERFVCATLLQLQAHRPSPTHALHTHSATPLAPTSSSEAAFLCCLACLPALCANSPCHPCRADPLCRAASDGALGPCSACECPHGSCLAPRGYCSGSAWSQAGTHGCFC